MHRTLFSDSEDKKDEKTMDEQNLGVGVQVIGLDRGNIGLEDDGS